MAKFCTAHDAAALVRDHATVTVSSSSALGCPDAVLAAIGERFVQTGHPRQITSVHPIAAGDMYGVPGVDHLAREGLLKRVIAGSLPSGPSSMPSPRIWQMIGDDQVEAYNLPSGILYHMHREAAAKRPGILTKVGMGTFVDPMLLGGRMNEHTKEDIVSRVMFDGQEWLYFRSIPIDVAIVRGTSADEDGNISTEHEGGFLGGYDQALAAHNNGGIVIAQVKRIVRSGSLPPQSIRIPGTVVDYVVTAPDQLQTTETPYEPAISGQVRVPDEHFSLMPWQPTKPMARRAAMELDAGDVVNLGFGISALVPRILLEAGQESAVTWAIEQGAVGGIPLLDFQFGCAANTQAIMASPDQFTYFHGGGFDKSFLSFLQIDAVGNVNVSRLSARPHVTAGVGGFIDITANARSIVFIGTFTTGGLRLNVEGGRIHIEREGKISKIVPNVEHVTFSGQRALSQSQHVTYITERCVIRLLPDGLTVTEIAPGIDLERDILGQTQVQLRVSKQLRLMDAKLFDPDSFNLRLGKKPDISGADWSD